MAIKKRTVITRSFVIIIALVMLFFFARWILTEPTHWVRTVVVTGVPKSEQAEFSERIEPLLHEPLVSLNIDQLASEILHFSWISDVSIRRVWPDQLLIHATRQSLVATWNQEFGLNRYGELFQLTQTAPQLIALFGPDDSQIETYGVYQQLQYILQPTGLTIQKLYQRPDNAWYLVTKNGMQIQLGSQHVLTRLQRFVKVYPKVFKSAHDAAGRRVDLRYAHGMAISRGKENG